MARATHTHVAARDNGETGERGERNGYNVGDYKEKVRSSTAPLCAQMLAVMSAHLAERQHYPRTHAGIQKRKLGKDLWRFFFLHMYIHLSIADESLLRPSLRTKEEKKKTKPLPSTPFSSSQSLSHLLLYGFV